MMLVVLCGENGVEECSGGVGEWSGGGDVAYREKENGPDLMVVPMLCLYRD